MDTSNLKDALKETDAAIDKLKADIKLGDSLDRLMKNQDFIDVILTGYLEVEAKVLFNILVAPSGASPYSDEVIQLKLAAISHFKSYVGTSDYTGTIKINAEGAATSLFREELYREQVTADFAAKG